MPPMLLRDFKCIDNDVAEVRPKKPRLGWHQICSLVLAAKKLNKAA
jgi:hypothetical protein